MPNGFISSVEGAIYRGKLVLSRMSRFFLLASLMGNYSTWGGLATGCHTGVKGRSPMVSQEGAQPNVLHHAGTVLVRLGSGGGFRGENWKRKAEEVRSGTERA